MTKFKYLLDRSSKKFICPSCVKEDLLGISIKLLMNILKKLMADATEKQVVVITIIQNKMSALQ